jgi:hypothetical protein
MNNLPQAIEYAKSGEKPRAKQLLTEIVQSEPNNEMAWLWLSDVVEDVSQQISCLERVLKINPGNQPAAAGLAKLKGAASQNTDTKDRVEVKSITNSKYRAQPVPDISKWSNGFARWSILDTFVETENPDPKLGILITEARIDTKRIFGWASFFILLAMLFGALVINDPAEFFLFGIVALVLLGAAIYRIVTWYLNRDLQVRIFRAGSTLRKDGKTQVVFWSEIEYVKEAWQKRVYHGIVHIKTHKIEIFKKNGEKLELDRSFEKIEEVGRLIQLAVADHLLAASVDTLKNNGTCDFGSFTINQFGITQMDFLPWNEVKSLDVHTVGQTIIAVQTFANNKRGTTWASKNGATLKNLHLFLSLSYWFIYASSRNETPLESDTDNGDVQYKLLLTKKEAQDGLQKTFYTGFPLQEKRLTVKIPAGVQTGTVYRFPDYGRPGNIGNGTAGTLTVEILVEKITSAQRKLQDVQLTGGWVLLLLGMTWLGFWSTLDIVSSTLLAILIGSLCGGIMSIGRRFLGIFSGAVGGALCYILQILYYEFMYIKFGRESFWNYESALVLFLSALPGIGLYILLKKIFYKKQP